MNIDERIERMEVRAKALGFHAHKTGVALNPKGDGFVVSSGIIESQGKGTWSFYGNYTEDDFTAAESLLSLHEPGDILVVRDIGFEGVTRSAVPDVAPGRYKLIKVNDD